MSNELTIRLEKACDHKAISRIIQSAFQDVGYSNQKEHLLVADLRKNDALTLSLVAQKEQEILGHIAFSEVTINGQFDAWYGLAPVAVLPEYQGRGIGSALIEHGLHELKRLGANGCVLVGEPDFYKRFGFQHQNQLVYEGVPAAYFLVQSFTDSIPEGEVAYHPLFSTYG